MHRLYTALFLIVCGVAATASAAERVEDRVQAITGTELQLATHGRAVLADLLFPDEARA